MLDLFLSATRSLSTRTEYHRDLLRFFDFVELSPEKFVALSKGEAISLILGYKSSLAGLADATVKRKMDSLKSLIKFAFTIEKCKWMLVKGDLPLDKVKGYRDTSGISPEQFKMLLAVPDRNTLKGKRDYALLLLLWGNALRRGEVCKCDISDLDLNSRKLWILGKGKGNQKEAISLSLNTTKALQDWLLERQATTQDQPLFTSFDPVTPRHRLTGTAIYQIVDEVAKAAGIDKQFSPHRIRHSAITAALVATGGNVRKVQKLSRHSNLNTLMIYDDNRLSHQGEITDLLADLV